MKRNLLFAMLGSLIILSCGQGNKENKSQNVEENIVYEQLILDSLLAKTENYIDKNVSFKGTVSHVCQHGGQKMFLFSTSDEETMKVTPGENYSEFQVELEGSTIKVEGIIREQRIDETYLAEWEAEVKQNKKEVSEGEDQEVKEHVGGQMGDHERTNVDMEKIQQLREKIEATEKGYLSNFSVECVNYEILEETVEEETTEEEVVEEEVAE